MPVRELICINCPMGCPLRVELDDGGNVLSVTGNTCKRGEDYGRKEVTAPMRTLTTTVGVREGEAPVVSVRTRGEIPKDMLFPCMEVLAKTAVNAPVALGDLIVADIAGTGVDVVATKAVKRRT